MFFYKNLQSAKKAVNSKLLAFRNLTANSYKLKANLGFTLIELLVVVGIISVVTGIVMTSINNAKAKGRDSKRIADVSVIQLALERYYDEYRYYPTSLSDSNLTNRGPIPVDPKTSSPYSYSALNSSNSAVCSSGSCQSYHLGATLELYNGVLDGDEDLKITPITSPDFDGTDTSLFVYDVVPKF